ncbi:MAG: hypothetical protein LUH23_08185, partial [Oscillospiraceae bacterium]|nr:hypothetical protein [Oscillospiraceae bacterium]
MTFKTAEKPAVFFCLTNVVHLENIPGGAPLLLMRSVKSNKGLLLTRVTEPDILSLKGGVDLWAA